jgi:murein L,D-transpeptidase YafK
MRLAGRSLAVLLVLYGVVVVGSAVWAGAGLSRVTCPASGAVVLVDTASRTLCLCNRGEMQGQFRVALGRGGVAKQAEGDGRTPIGAYGLSEARPSSRFGLFLPVGYPTPEQEKLGYTGSAVGVHGPHVAFFWLRHATVWLNWTAGCIAVGTQSDIEAIAEWVHSTGAREIVIS